MSKEKDGKQKSDKTAPAKTLKEKRAAKEQKTTREAQGKYFVEKSYPIA
jgi:hypothetical protein